MLEKNQVGKFKMQYVIITFFYLFYFKFVNIPFVSVLDSTIIVGIYLSMVYFFSPSMRRKFSELLLTKSIKTILIFCSFLIVFACFITIIHVELDFSICIPLFHQLIFLLIGLEYYSYLSSKGQEKNIIYFFVIAYCLQTIIQYLSFLNPEFHSFTNLFKTDYEVGMQRLYSGFRLNAISGGIAFSLAAGYAVITAFFLLRWKELTQLTNSAKTNIFILLMAGGLCAGRTAILLIFLVLVCILLKNAVCGRYVLKFKKRSLVSFAIFPFVLMAIYYLALSFLQSHPEIQDSLTTVQYWLSKWDQYLGADTDNFNFWDDMASKLPSVLSLIIGDGRYMELDGANYLHQDAGYIRILAFGGIPWLILLFFYQKQFFVTNRRFEKICIMALILIGTLKADFLGMLLQTQLIIFPIYLLNNDEATEYREREYNNE